MGRMNSARPHLLSLPTLLALASLAMLLLVARAGAKDEQLVYYGTYTGKKSKGIYVSRFSPATGRLSPPELAAEIVSPSFLAVHPSGRTLYAVNEVGQFEGKKAGAVSAFALDPATGKLALLNQHSSGGSGPCHLEVDRKGRNVLVANYGGGSIAALPLRSDGSLLPASSFVQHAGSSADPNRQAAPHAHGIYVDRANRHAYVPDLGLDKVLIYQFDSKKGALVANPLPSVSVAPGAGPRHFAFHPKGRFAYVINERVCTVTAFVCDPKSGGLQEIQTLSTLPPEEAMKPQYNTAELFVHPSGKFLYGSNRGHDTLVVYAIHAKDGRLTHIENVSTQGKIPRGFGIDPSGKWLLAANQNSDNVVVFAINPESGRLSSHGQTVEVGSPVSITFVPTK